MDYTARVRNPPIQDLRRLVRRATDPKAKRRIAARLLRLEVGHVGDAKAVGGGVSELRIDYGPGYRVYFTRRGEKIYLLLCGGDKSTQDADIRRAKQMVKEI